MEIPLYIEVSSLWNKGVPLYVEVSSFRGAGIKRFYRINDTAIYNNLFLPSLCENLKVCQFLWAQPPPNQDAVSKDVRYNHTSNLTLKDSVIQH